MLKEIANGGSLENQIMFGTTELLRITWKLFICKTNKMVYVKGGFNGFRLIEAEDVGVIAFAEAMRGLEYYLIVRG